VPWAAEVAVLAWAWAGRPAREQQQGSVMITCPFCRTQVAGVSDAREACWEPLWWSLGESGEEVCHDTPVCPRCCRDYLVRDAGECVLRRGVPVPPHAGCSCRKGSG